MTCCFRCLLPLVVVFSIHFNAGSQSVQSVPEDTLGTSILIDDPGFLRDLYLGIQPMYGETAGSGSHAGFGVELKYRQSNKLDFRLQFRKPWSARLFDQSRDDALQNSNTSNSLVAYAYAEAGLSYQLRDIRKTDTILVPLKERASNGPTQANSWKMMTALPATYRSVTSLRLGMSVRQSVTDVSEALRRQGSLNASVLLPETFTDTDGITRPFRIFSSGRNSFLYAGVSRSFIRNFSVAFDHYAVSSRDASLTLFADLLVSAGNSLENAQLNGLDFSLDPVRLSRMGIRIGLDFTFERKLGYAIGWEAGIRPGIAETGRYALIKISLPVFGWYTGRLKSLNRKGAVMP